MYIHQDSKTYIPYILEFNTAQIDEREIFIITLFSFINISVYKTASRYSFIISLDFYIIDFRFSSDIKIPEKGDPDDLGFGRS